MGDGVQRKNKWSEAGNFQGVMKEGDLASGHSMLPWGRGVGMVYPSAEIWTDGEGWETGGSFQKDFSARHFSLTHALWVLSSECQWACCGRVNVSGQLFQKKLNSALKLRAEDFRAGPLSQQGKVGSFFLSLSQDTHPPPRVSPGDPFIHIPSPKLTCNR